MLSIERAATYIEEHGEPLYSAYFAACFTGGDSREVMRCLKTYQRPDGGFGGGLETDLLLPDSSPMAVTKAFQIFERLSLYPDDMVAPAIDYLERTFIPDRKGWITCPIGVNEHPHAPWWEYKPEYGGILRARSLAYSIEQEPMLRNLILMN